MKPTLVPIPIRIVISTRRYAVAASLFYDIYRENAYDLIDRLSPKEERVLGIFPVPSAAEKEHADAADAYFVRPADPAVLHAKKTGKPTDAIEESQFVTEGYVTVISDDFGMETETPADAGPVASSVDIVYHEALSSGMEGSLVKLTYRTDNPDLITLTRTGSVRTAMTFLAHHRVICSYDTQYIPLHIGIHAITVDNRLDEDRELLLDYIIEVKGGVAERCTMRLKIAALDPAQEDSF